MLVLAALVSACAKEPKIEPFVLEGKRLTINNLSKDTWKDVRIQINRQYLVQTTELLPGQRFDVSLDAFLDVYGNRFYYQRQQIKDVHLTAKVAGGADVDTHMEFTRSGLQGLADSGVFKKKEKQ